MTLRYSFFPYRPLRYQYRKETKERIKTEIKRLEDEVAQLGTYYYHPNISFGFTAIMSMIDGKVVNVWHENDCTAGKLFSLKSREETSYGLSFYVTKTVLV